MSRDIKTSYRNWLCNNCDAGCRLSTRIKPFNCLMKTGFPLWELEILTIEVPVDTTEEEVEEILKEWEK